MIYCELLIFYHPISKFILNDLNRKTSNWQVTLILWRQVVTDKFVWQSWAQPEFAGKSPLDF